MIELSISYASPDSGTNAKNIGWIDFGDINLNPGERLTGLTVKLINGSILTFDIRNDSNPNYGYALTSTTVSVTSDSSFWNEGYTDIQGKVALIKSPLANSIEAADSALFTITNIQFFNASGNITSNFKLALADLYSAPSNATGTSSDLQQYITNSAQLSILDNVGTGPAPTIEITDESSVPAAVIASYSTFSPLADTAIAVADINYSSLTTQNPILEALSPTLLQANYVANSVDITQGFTFGIFATTVTRGINLFS